MSNKKVIISSTSTDTDGEAMTKESLVSIANDVNSSDRKPMINIEHDPSLLPIGCGINAEVKDREDGTSLLMMENKFYNYKEMINSEDEGVLVKLSFKCNNHPLRILDDIKNEKLTITVDPNCFVKEYDIKKYTKEIKQDTKMDFEIGYKIRKSEFPNPILILNILPQALFYWYGSKLIYKYLEKNVELLAENNFNINDLIALIKNAATRLLKNSKSKEIIFILESQGITKIQLLMKTFNVDELLESLNKLNIGIIEDKIEKLNIIYSPEFIQFIYDRKTGWKFNYLVNKKGETIGTYKSYEKTKYEFKKINSGDIFSSMEFKQKLK